MNLFKRLGKWFGGQNTGNKIAIIGLIITAISSVLLPMILYFLSPEHNQGATSRINSPVIQQAPNSKSEIIYNTNNNVTSGADSRDIETYLKKLKPGTKNQKYIQIDEFYNNKEISSELKDTLYTVVDYMESNIQATNQQISNLEKRGNIQLATSLEKINNAFAQSDITNIITITDQETAGTSVDNAKVYINTANKLMDILRYDEAEIYYKKAIALQEQAGMQNTSGYANSLNELAKLYRTQEKYALAQPLFKQAIEIWSNSTGTNSTEYATGLNEQAYLYDEQGQYDLAEPLYIESLNIFKNSSGINSVDYAIGLNNLAQLYDKQKQYNLVEPMYKEALEIFENSSGINSVAYAFALNNLAYLYYEQNKFQMAKPLYKKALSIIEPAFGMNHSTTINILNNFNKLQISIP